MAKEIERKFLVTGTSYRDMAVDRHEIAQGYLSRDIDATVRVRIVDEKAFLTVKGRNHGVVRDEWEYAIPVNDAVAMLDRCVSGHVIRKTRYIVPSGSLRWEIDEFHDCHAGLVVAEIELPSPDAEFTKPVFIGEEVSGNPAYYNSNL